eukprot:COSAG05_NODE_24113_length_253_cov_1.701299_1_plen_34_part_01
MGSGTRSNARTDTDRAGGQRRHQQVALEVPSPMR